MKATISKTAFDFSWDKFTVGAPSRGKVTNCVNIAVKKTGKNAEALVISISNDLLERLGIETSKKAFIRIGFDILNSRAAIIPCDSKEIGARTLWGASKKGFNSMRVKVSATKLPFSALTGAKVNQAKFAICDIDNTPAIIVGMAGVMDAES